MAKKPEMIFHLRGYIERGDGKGGYVWKEGYSQNSENGNVLYPWNTFRECQREAVVAGCKAVFVRNGK